jgi:hypothetical protein
VVLYVVRCTYGFRRTSDRISVAQMSMGHGSFSPTMKYSSGVPADLQKQAAEALGELLFGVSNGPAVDPTPVIPRTVGGTEGGVAGETPAKYRFM